MAVVTQLLVPLNDAIPESLDRGSCIVHVHQNAVRGQILEQVGCALEEQRQEILDAARRNPGTDVAVYRLFRQISGESQAVAAAEFTHRVGIERCLSRGQELNAVQLVHGPLRVRIKATDAVDLAIQHVDPVGRL